MKRQSRKWYVEYRDAQGIRRRVPGYTDKPATQQLASELERQAAREQAGLVDRFANHCKRPPAEHVDDRRVGLLAKGDTVLYANMSANRVRCVFDGCRFAHWPDLSASRVSRFLSDRRNAGLSVESSNHRVRAVKGFCAWCVRDGRAPESPLAHLQTGNTRTDRRHDRRAFTLDELRTLLETTRNSPTRYGMAGTDRATLYQLAVETGLRPSYARSRGNRSIRTRPRRGWWSKPRTASTGARTSCR